MLMPELRKTLEKWLDDAATRWTLYNEQASKANDEYNFFCSQRDSNGEQCKLLRRLIEIDDGDKPDTPVDQIAGPWDKPRHL